MSAKYPEFKDEIDLDALERWMYHVTKWIGRRSVSPHENNFFMGLAYRASPYYRRKTDATGIDLKDILLVATWQNWDGEEE